MGRPAARKAGRETRRGSKRDQSRLRVVEGNFSTEPDPVYKPNKEKLVPRNHNQSLYLTALKSSPITISTGEAGCGKSFIATVYASDALQAKDFERIVVTRPVVQCDEDLGFLPGDIAEKFAPYFRPVHEILKERMGRGALDYALKPEVEKIMIAPFAFIRGMTFKNAVVILDEAQNTTVGQMKTFITRLGEGSQLIINGDPDQCDLPKGVKSGLVDLIERFERNPHLSERMKLIKFNEEDSVRSEICSIGLELYR